MTNYLFIIMLGFSISAMGMDRTFFVPQAVREGSLVRVGSDNEIISYLKLAHKPSVTDWVVVRDADNNDQYVWARIAAAKKELLRQNCYTIVYTYTVVQKRHDNGLQLRRELPLEQLHALVIKSHQAGLGLSSDKENENSMDFHWFCEVSNQ